MSCITIPQLLYTALSDVPVHFAVNRDDWKMIEAQLMDLQDKYAGQPIERELREVWAALNDCIAPLTGFQLRQQFHVDFTREVVQDDKPKVLRRLRDLKKEAA